jgi:hypothetical protein
MIRGLEDLRCESEALSARLDEIRAEITRLGGRPSTTVTPDETE